MPKKTKKQKLAAQKRRPLINQSSWLTAKKANLDTNPTPNYQLSQLSLTPKTTAMQAFDINHTQKSVIKTLFLALIAIVFEIILYWRLPH